MALNLLQEVRHELLMRDKFEPGKGESRELVRIQLIEEVSKGKHDVTMSFEGEALLMIESS